MTDDDAPWPQLGNALDEVNKAFHDAYADRRQARESPREAPALVFIADTLVLFCGEREQTLAVTPRGFHALKSVAHIPIALFLLLSARSDAEDETRRRRLRTALDNVTRALDGEPDLGGEPGAGARTDAAAIVRDSQELLAAPVGGLASGALDAYAAAQGPRVLRLTDAATAMQLEALHHAVETIVAPLTTTQRRALQIVVVGDHQARERSLALQYFSARCREAPGTEERVAYAEGATDAKAALALVGTRRLDRLIARAFFGDEKRLQRDVLGDATKRRLDEWQPPPLG